MIDIDASNFFPMNRRSKLENRLPGRKNHGESADAEAVWIAARVSPTKILVVDQFLWLRLDNCQRILTTPIFW
jgi:hypothetical protein